MSWGAKRYENRKLNGHRDKDEITTHHVPPRSRGATLFTLKKKYIEHVAYHVLFGNAASLEECIQILRREWWTPQDNTDTTNGG